MFPSVSVELYLASNKQRGKSKRMRVGYLDTCLEGNKNHRVSVRHSPATWEFISTVGFLPCRSSQQHTNLNCKLPHLFS